MTKGIKRERYFNGKPYYASNVVESKKKAEQEKLALHKSGRGVRIVSVNEFGRTNYVVYATKDKPYKERWLKRPVSKQRDGVYGSYGSMRSSKRR